MIEKNVFSDGSKPSLKEVLQTRENRALLEFRLGKKFKRPVIAFKLNIPGPVKNNEMIRQVFLKGYTELQDLFEKKCWSLLYEKEIDLATGPEYLCVVDVTDAEAVKKEAVKLEETKLGRLYDIDILSFERKNICAVGRKTIGLSERTCFICGQRAKFCSRSRAHSVQEMLEKLETIIQEEGSVMTNGS